MFRLRKSHCVYTDSPKSKKDRTKSKQASQIRNSHFGEGCLTYILGPDVLESKLVTRDGENIITFSSPLVGTL